MTQQTLFVLIPMRYNHQSMVFEKTQTF